jgi:hypothetical protein
MPFLSTSPVTAPCTEDTSVLILKLKLLSERTSYRVCSWRIPDISEGIDVRSHNHPALRIHRKLPADFPDHSRDPTLERSPDGKYGDIQFVGESFGFSLFRARSPVGSCVKMHVPHASW